MLKRQIDVHGMTKTEALREVQKFIEEHYKLGTSSIEVIHGYSHGSVLHDTFTKKSNYHSSKIDRIEISFINPGMTVVYLKKKK